MTRHTNTEQLGINAINTIVSEDLDWIYRPVPPPDVGIDGTIEQKVNGNPTAKFIAVQLKTGLSHFNHDRKKNRLTYNATLVHYNYWLSSNIPVILVAHIPDWKMTYWQIIDKSKFKKLKKSWQLDIPLTNTFGTKSIRHFNKLLSQASRSEELSSRKRTVFDYLEDANLVHSATERTTSLTELMHENAGRVRLLRGKIKEFSARKIGFDDPEVDAQMTSAGLFFNRLSRRFSLEVQLFAECYALSISAYPKLIKLQFEASGEYEDLPNKIMIFDDLSVSLESAVEAMNVFVDVLKNSEKWENSVYNEGIQLLRSSIQQAVTELTVAFEMAATLSAELKKL